MLNFPEKAILENISDFARVLAKLVLIRSNQILLSDAPSTEGICKGFSGYVNRNSRKLENC